MRILFFLFFLAAGAAAQMPPIEPGVSQKLAQWRATQYSNISYKLNLTGPSRTTSAGAGSPSSSYARNARALTTGVTTPE